MSKWVHNDNHVHDNTDGWCAHCKSEVDADRIVKRHKRDCDTYDARIAALEAINQKTIKTIREYAENYFGHFNPQDIREILAIAEGKDNE